MDGELGAFLRARREALTPADVGLPQGSRRRTPGLRREELATLAGVSIDYLIRIEQGRDTNPSPQVLSALAEALRLGPEDLAHLRDLAAMGNGALCPAEMPVPARSVRPQVSALLGSLEPSPAVVVNHLTDLLAWNDGYDRLVRPLGMLDDEQPNWLGYHFGDPRARRAFGNWDRAADELVAFLHEMRRGDPGVDAFAERLSRLGGSAFQTRWRRRPLLAQHHGTTSLLHPQAGPVRLGFEALELGDRSYQRLVVYLPADEAASAALFALAGRQPGTLRAVRG